MLKVVLTGGPCAGKTTVIDCLLKVYQNRAVRVAEAATILLDGGFPVRQHSPGWRVAFQRAVAGTQLALEAIAQAEASAEGMELLLHDRGMVDGAAYLGGLDHLAVLAGLRAPALIGWYDLVVHLQSLAVTRPDAYGRPGNAARLESVTEAAALDRALLRAWRSHPRRVVVGYYPSLEQKVAAVAHVIDDALARLARAA